MKHKSNLTLKREHGEQLRTWPDKSNTRERKHCKPTLPKSNEGASLVQPQADTSSWALAAPNESQRPRGLKNLLPFDEGTRRLRKCTPTLPTNTFHDNRTTTQSQTFGYGLRYCMLVRDPPQPLLQQGRLSCVAHPAVAV